MAESLIRKQGEVQGLSTAILSPSASLLGDGGREPPDKISPLISVAGISLFQRTVLTIQRAGIRQLIVLVGPEEDQLKQALGQGPYQKNSVRWMSIREFPLDDPRTWKVLAAEVRGFCLFSSVRGVFSSALIESLGQEAQEAQATVVAYTAHQRVRPLYWSGLHVKTEEGRLLSLTSTQDHTMLMATDLVVLPASFMGEVAQISGTVCIREWLEQAALEGQVRVRLLSTDTNESHWYQGICDVVDVQAAEKKLFNSLKSESESFVDHFFNRKISRWVSPIFLTANISPNAITVFAAVVGLVAAASFSVGTYSAGIIAALLFQMAAVIDCCDGEVARLTFTESLFGAWLDIVMDNVVHMAIFGGIAVGLFLRVPESERGWIFFTLGSVAVVGNGACVWLVSHALKCKAASNSSILRHPLELNFMLKNVANRDFSVIVLLFAVMDKLHWFLWMAAIGSVVFSLLMVWAIRPRVAACA